MSVRAYTPDSPMRLDEAARIAFPLGNMTKSGVRREIERGNLDASRIAGRYFVTLLAIREMMDRCRVQKHHPDCGSDRQQPTVQQSGSSRTAAIAKAQAALKAKLNAPGRLS